MSGGYFNWCLLLSTGVSCMSATSDKQLQTDAGTCSGDLLIMRVTYILNKVDMLLCGELHKWVGTEMFNESYNTSIDLHGNWQESV